MNLLEDQVIADRESPERKAEKQANELLALKVQELEESLGNVKEIDQSKKLWEEIGKLWDGLKEHRDGIDSVKVDLLTRIKDIVESLGNKASAEDVRNMQENIADKLGIEDAKKAKDAVSPE